MTNTNCLAGIQCPRCGSEDAFYISACVLAHVTDDGAEPAENSSISWDESSETECAECGAAGPLTMFTTASL